MRKNKNSDFIGLWDLDSNLDILGIFRFLRSKKPLQHLISNIYDAAQNFVIYDNCVTCNMKPTCTILSLEILSPIVQITYIAITK